MRSEEATRREFLARALATGLAATVAGALPTARALVAPEAARAQDPGFDAATLQAFYDTIIPGRKVTTTSLGAPVHPKAILGVDDRPGAVEADALALGNHPLIGFAYLAPAFLADLELRAAAAGGSDFLSLDWDGREAACRSGFAFDNPLRLTWEAAGAVPFVAFCAAGMIPEQTAEKAVGYRVMGLPGRVSAGYADASYRRRLSRERTKTGNLP
ncbi:DUF5987 family protein [Paraconexibacter sp.]|uniref:DUF5987 family protein n=1 Tax=Paraconexibacter sp. TaxID=2949640 RepID=UPI00356544C8